MQFNGLKRRIHMSNITLKIEGGLLKEPMTYVSDYSFANSKYLSTLQVEKLTLEIPKEYLEGDNLKIVLGKLKALLKLNVQE